MARPHPRITELLADRSASSRSDIARLLRVAPSTVSAWVRQFIDAGVVVEDGLVASEGGRPRRRFRLSRPLGYLLVAELGGNHARLGVTNRTGRLLYSTTLSLTMADGSEQVLGPLATPLRDQPAEEELAGMGLALSGPVQSGGAVRLPPRIPGWAGLLVQGALMESFGVLVVAENDANAMALGEHRTQFGSEGDSITVKAGTATGSGIVIVEQLYRGATFVAGDVTHTVAHTAGNRPCTCRKTGYLGTVASGVGIVARLVEQGVKVTNTAGALAPARDGDPGVTITIRTVGPLLDEVLNSVVSFFNPQVLFLAGGLAPLQHFVTVVRARIHDECHPLMTESLRIETVSLGADAALAGMVLLAAAAIRDAILQAGAVLTGAHVDADVAIAQAVALGADIAQVTLGDPQSWRKPAVPGDGVTTLRSQAEDAGIGPYVHAAHVINVTSTDNRIRIPSRKLLQQTIDTATGIGANGMIVHGGHVTVDEDQRRGYENWRKCADGLDLKVPILIENTVGGKEATMRYLESIRDLWATLDGSDNLDGVGLCLDTCHAYAAGLNLTTAVEDVRAVTDRTDPVHCNDPHDVAGSGRGRHVPLGRGQLDPEALIALLRGANTPVVPETPPENHAEEIAWLREQLG